MATSGSVSVAVTSWDTLKFSWSESSQSVSANTTTISWKMQLIAGSSGRISSTASKAWSVTVNGAKYSGTNTISISNNATKTLASGSTVISHNADGTKKFPFSFSQTFDITFSGSSIGTKSGSGSGTLDTIPRASTPTLSSSSVNMGSAVTITTNRASSSFTHDLAYSFAGESYVSIATGVGASYSWTTPDLASKIPNATSGTVTIRCITKSGSTTIGTKTVTMTLKVPTSVVPTISAVSVVEATDGLAAQFGAFVKSKSKVKATITAAGAKGSTIKSYSTTFNGKTYTGSSWTSSVLTGSGALKLVTTVTDSRGRTAKKTTAITVLDYSKPIIDLLQVYRVNADGAAADDGAYIAVRYKYSVTSLNSKNTASMVIQYKRSTETEWTDLLTGSSLSADTTALPTSPTFSTDYQYDVRLTLSDYFGSATPYLAVLQSGAVILDIGADGDCLGIGETAQFPGHVGIAWTLKTKHGEIPRDALAIPASANLDDYLDPGYYVFSSAASSTITGLPFTGGSGSVEVIREGDYNQVRQVVTRCSATNREIWERLYYSSTWQAWACVYKGGTGRVLWNGGMYMTSGHTITLSEAISEQPNGVVLVFSAYTDATVGNYWWSSHFVPKQIVANHAGTGQCFQMAAGNFSVVAMKYLMIKDTTITGHDNNNLTGTASGVTFANNRFVLRYVIGV